MSQESKEEAAAIMRRINRAWQEGDVEDLARMVHPDIVMAFPGFNGGIEGREAFLAGFRDFCQNATIHEFRDDDYNMSSLIQL
jgi:ketosteroid isomerase-like protein